VLEPYAVKVARTVLRGRKLPGSAIISIYEWQFKSMAFKCWMKFNDLLNIGGSLKVSKTI
jgi:hypothetical protein